MQVRVTGQKPVVMMVLCGLFACQGPVGTVRPGEGFGANSLVAQGGANLVAQGGANLVAQGGANLVAQGGANLVAQGGANLVAQGGANLVAQGGANFVLVSGFAKAPPGLVAQGGANLVAQGGANLVAQGGANLVAQGGANLVAQGGANYILFQVAGAMEPLVGSEIYLTDATGKPLVGAEATATDAEGRYVFSVRRGLTFLVSARVSYAGGVRSLSQAGGNVGRILTTMGSSGREENRHDITLGTTLATAKVLAEAKKDVALDPGRLESFFASFTQLAPALDKLFESNKSEELLKQALAVLPPAAPVLPNPGATGAPVAAESVAPATTGPDTPAATAVPLIGSFVELAKVLEVAVEGNAEIAQLVELVKTIATEALVEILPSSAPTDAPPTAAPTAVPTDGAPDPGTLAGGGTGGGDGVNIAPEDISIGVDLGVNVTMTPGQVKRPSTRPGIVVGAQ